MTRNPSDHERGRSTSDADADRDGVSRRTVLRRASAAGAGATIVAGEGLALDDSSSVGTLQFADVGVEYTIEGDVRPPRADDCVHPQYDVVDGEEVVFYTEAMKEPWLDRVRGANDVVAGLRPNAVPANEVPLMENGFLPTTLGEGLHPRRGVIVKETHSPPAPRVVRAGDKLVVRTRGPAVKVAPGEERTVELETREVAARRYERQPTEGTSEKVPGKTIENGAKYVATTEPLDATPTLTVRNHGEVTVHEAVDRAEASR